ncbi:MAG: 4Fe-4S dicluster domain-containing protein [Acidobacteria bacterium]|jgi:NAD-dependent dihydropyrimidine dehydrogenase PreA subunit|nr:4Fe-4S dicluster domain-containing protein [Acidobacteriota bacterium]
MAGAAVEIDFDLCDNTQACEAVCPTTVFEIVDGRVHVAQPSECTVCMKCVENCPAGAVTVDF